MTQEQKQIETPEPATVEPTAENKTMLIKRVVKNTDGGLDATISLTPSQSHFLLNFALTFLLAQGAIQFVDVPEDNEQETIDDAVVVLGEDKNGETPNNS